MLNETRQTPSHPDLIFHLHVIKHWHPTITTSSLRTPRRLFIAEGLGGSGGTGVTGVAGVIHQEHTTFHLPIALGLQH